MRLGLRGCVIWAFLGLAASAPAWAGPDSGDGVLGRLRAARAVSREEVGATTDLLREASLSLRARWDPALVREAARVLNLSMNRYKKTYETIASPFHLQLLGERKKEFIDLVLPALSEENRRVFLRFAEVLARVEREGNG